MKLAASGDDIEVEPKQRHCMTYGFKSGADLMLTFQFLPLKAIAIAVDSNTSTVHQMQNQNSFIESYEAMCIT